MVHADGDEADADLGLEKKRRRLLVPTAMILALILALLPEMGLLAFSPAPAAAAPATANGPDRVYFPQTGHYLAYGFLDYWRANGGLMMFGYPITGEFQQGGLTVQYFQRAVFEYHPDAPAGWMVQLRRLGSIATASQANTAPFTPVSAANDQDCTFYQQTGHRLCFGFRDYWENHGGLPMFGYPISEEFSENGVTVQYFERARFEYHPNNPPQFQVLLGLLGSQAAAVDQVSTAPLPPSSTVATYAPNLWPPQNCQPWQLDAAMQPGGAALGHVRTIFTLHNDSRFTCVMDGYPGLLMLDAQGNPLPTRVGRGGSTYFSDLLAPPTLVTLAPGQTASFAAEWGDNPAGSASDEPYNQACPTSWRLEITPPNDFDHLIIPAQIHPCEGGIDVSPVAPGPNGPPLPRT